MPGYSLRNIAWCLILVVLHNFLDIGRTGNVYNGTFPGTIQSNTNLIFFSYRSYVSPKPALEHWSFCVSWCLDSSSRKVTNVACNLMRMFYRNTVKSNPGTTSAYSEAICVTPLFINPLLNRNTAHIIWRRRLWHYIKLLGAMRSYE